MFFCTSIRTIMYTLFCALGAIPMLQYGSKGGLDSSVESLNTNFAPNVAATGIRTHFGASDQ
jgi:hypothetical protein